MLYTHRQQSAGIQEWINDIACCLMEGKYTNRSRLQRQLMALETALRKLENRREVWEWRKFRMDMF